MRFFADFFYKRSGALGVVVLLCFLSFTWGCRSSASDKEEADTASLPADFGKHSDSDKARYLLEHNVSVDSLASFVIECVGGNVPGVSFTDFDDIELLVAERLGDEALGTYLLCFETGMQRLPLAKKYQLKKQLPLTDMSLLGFTLGLDYSNKIIDSQLSLGKVDREVAEFYRACNQEESVYEDFLKGLATGLTKSASRGVPEDVAAKYANRHAPETTGRYPSASSAPASEPSEPEEAAEEAFSSIGEVSHVIE